ncbi:MAG: thermonuclease family protein [Lentisphaeria bacterium]|nr:thermonuclease family protein [Lentisphaeria bacterium]
MQKHFILFILIQFLQSSYAEDIKYYGRIDYVYDGDSCRLVTKHGKLEVRLRGIDAPEKGQDFSQKSRKNLIRLLGNQQVEVRVVEVDKHQRIIAWLFVGHQNINVKQVSDGFAWYLKWFEPNNNKLLHAEELARKKKKGLWSHKHPIPPWEFRKLKKEK